MLKRRLLCHYGICSCIGKPKWFCHWSDYSFSVEYLFRARSLDLLTDVCLGDGGLSVGAMRHTLFMKNKWLRILYGLAIGYFFGWFMNLWAILGSNLPLTWLNIFAYGVSSFFFDLAHGLSNMFFLGIFAPSWIQTIRRFKEKYGLFPEIS